MLKKSLIISFLSVCFQWCFGNDWQIEKLTNLPEAISNNAVVGLEVNGEYRVYTFGGIDSTKVFDGIHLKSYFYNSTTDSWMMLPDLPDTLGKIASAASVVKNKIYIIGGYHVYSNGSEASSQKVHVFNPTSNSFESDATNIPVSIDDQVQAVWRDSLIYVISGWHDNNNVRNVQIFNPGTNTWQQGSKVPSQSNDAVFGASGCIIGDTIYYLGGARFGFNFPLVSFLRKGVIQKNNPDSIQWSSSLVPNQMLYRSASFAWNNKAYWFGGASVSYNYNGIAYNGSGGVAALNSIRELNAALLSDSITIRSDTVCERMDLRGIAVDEIRGFTYVVGGMEKNQRVTNSVFRIQLPSKPTSIFEAENKDESRVEYFPAKYAFKDGQLYRNSESNETLPKKELILFNSNGQEIGRLQFGVHTSKVTLSTKVLAIRGVKFLVDWEGIIPSVTRLVW